MKSDPKKQAEKSRKLQHELLKAKWSVFYMRYVKILVLAIMEIIAELYGESKK